MNTKRYLFYGTALLALSGLLASCATPAVKPFEPAEYVLTVNVGADDTRESVLQKYGGEAISWHPEAGFAILKLSADDKARLSSEVSVQTVPNSILNAPEVSASSYGAWASGVDLWGGGFNSWSGGWSTWGGSTSTIPALPGENRYGWVTLKLHEANSHAKNFGAGVKVAVVDTGLDTAHPMFSGRLAPSTEWKDYVGGDTNPAEVSGGSAYGHGTAVAGIILQVAPKATILPIRVLDQNGMGDVAKVVASIDWAIQKGAKIINLSLGTNVDVAALKTQIDYATSQGIYVVASAGNEGNSTALTYPAAYAKTGTNAKYMISVGSSGTDNNYMSTFSNRGPALEVVAPGEQFYSAYPGNKVAEVKGTSFAAPIVAGTLALLSKETAAANAANLENNLLGSSWDLVTGERHLNISYALSSLPDFVKWRKALLVVGSTTLNAGDTELNTYLGSWMNYAVTIKSGASVTTADATGKDLVVISSTVNPTDVNTKFKNVSTPVMVMEPMLFDDMGMVTASSSYYGTASNQTQVKLVNFTHPLSAGIYWAEHDVFAAPNTMTWGIPGANAVKIATLPTDSSKAVIFGYDKNVSMVGLTAPGRRVGFMFHDTSSANVTSSWGSDILFTAAVTWAATGN